MSETINPKDFEKIGFVASGGSAKALLYHIGVTLALKERGIEFRQEPNANDKSYIDLVVGSSGGAIFSALVSNGFNQETIEKKLEEKGLLSYVFNTKKRKRGDLTGFSYTDIFALNLPQNKKEFKEIHQRIKSIGDYVKGKKITDISLETVAKKMISIPDGFFRLDKLGKYLEDVLVINDFNELKKKRGIELYIIGTELGNPRKAIFGPKMSDWIGTDEDDFYSDRYLNNAKISEAVPASCAVPGMFRPVEINKVKYIDGETKKTLSSHVARDNNCGLIIVSHTFTPDFKLNGTSRNFGLYDILNQAVQTTMYQKIQTPRALHVQNEKMFKHFASEEFKEKTEITEEQQKEILNAFEENIDFKRDRRFIYIPAPPQAFDLDYFNIFPTMVNELINIGYATANTVLNLHNVPKLPEYEKVGVLNNTGIKKKKFRLLDRYVKKQMKVYFPGFRGSLNF